MALNVNTDNIRRLCRAAGPVLVRGVKIVLRITGDIRFHMRQVLRYLYFVKAYDNFEVNIPLRKRIWAWRRGFLSEMVVLLKLDEQNRFQYLPDIPHRLQASPIQGIGLANITINKFVLPYLFRDFKEHLLPYYYILLKGRIIPVDPQMDDRAGTVDDIFRCAGLSNGIILKPYFYGSGGHGVFLLQHRNGKLFLDHRQISEGDLHGFIQSLDEYLITPAVVQAEYSKKIFPDSANTLRVMTYWDYDDNEPFIGAIIHRFGRKESAPTDNWCRGGICCGVGRTSGKLTKAVGRPDGSGERWYREHPDTGEPIEGVTVANFELVCEKIIEMCHKTRYLCHIAWDVVVTEKGFVVLEINCTPGVGLVQVFTPLLANPRLRKFYMEYEPYLKRYGYRA